MSKTHGDLIPRELEPPEQHTQGQKVNKMRSQGSDKTRERPQGMEDRAAWEGAATAALSEKYVQIMTA